ncbi:MAG: winged helix-turn-helix domain-containing protein, partial [Pseudomonadota bacterium]
MTALPVAKNGSNDTRNDSPGKPGNGISGFRIADWTVEPALTRLTRNGETFRLEPKVMAVLVYLAERPGQAIGREELEEAVWAGTIVSYDALTGAIQKLRKAFNDDSRHPRIIETLSKKGYRLVAPVERVQEPAAGITIPLEHGDSASTRRRGIGSILATLVLTGLLVVGAVIWFAPWETVERSVARDGTITNSIAVLPFDNLSGDPTQEYFADGITDDLTTGLAKHPDLLVIARDSAFVYKDPSLSLDEIANKLEVRYILHGSVRRAGEQVWINTQLIDSENGSMLWAESYESYLDDVFELQNRIARDIASSLAVISEAANDEFGTYQQTRSSDAYDTFLRGRQYFYLYASKDENLRARDFFKAAIRYDSQYALAYAMLAWTYVYDALNGWSVDREASLHRALELANKAVSLNKALPVAYFVTGISYRELGEYVKALVEAEKAIEYEPNYANAHLLLATLLVHAG